MPEHDKVVVSSSWESHERRKLGYIMDTHWDTLWRRRRALLNQVEQDLGAIFHLDQKMSALAHHIRLLKTRPSADLEAQRHLFEPYLAEDVSASA